MKNNFYLNRFLKKALQSWALYSMTFVLASAAFTSKVIAGSGIFESYAVFNGTFYDLQNPTPNPDFQGFSLGNFPSGTNFTLGGEIKTFKNGSDNICGGNIWYSVYPAAGSPGVFTNISLPFLANLVNPGDQQWGVSPGTSIAFPTIPGAYKIAVYVTDIGDGSGGCTLDPFHTSNNGGANWVANFNVCGSGVGALPGGTYAIPGCFATVQSAVTYINANGVSGAVTFAVAAGHTETAPNGGITITATGTAVNTITFVKNGIGTNPTITAFGTLTSGALHDAIIEIVGGDYITFDGFTLLENAGNTTTAAATNNMTEWGVALLYATTTNGAQNCTIKNCTIDLNRTYQNTWGIYSNSTHSATVVSTSATATTVAGSNSNLTITGNTITDVNLPILVIGPTAATDHNDVLTIGGTLGNTNTITNWGTTGTFSSYANVSGTVNGILVRNSKNYNISFNTITSSNGGHTVGANIRGVYIPSYTNAPTGTITNSINNNTISVVSGLATATITGISIESTTVNSTTTQNFNNNGFISFGHSVSGSGSITFIINAGVSLSQNINSNTFTNLNLNTTGSVTFISNNVTAPTGGSKNVNSNMIVTSFNKTGAGGAINLYTDNASSVAGVIINNNNNNFSNITVTGSTTISGWVNTDGGSPTKTITGNTFSNWVGGTGSIEAMRLGFAASAIVSSNLVSNITSSGNINGIASNGGSQTFSGNTIHSLTSTGTSATINAFTFSGGTANTISKNKIYNLSGNQTGNIISGINITSGTTFNIDNNIIGDLRATAATGTNAVIGINASASSVYNIFYNTIRLDATSSSVTTFGNSCISFSSTVTSMNLRNNILINSSTPGSNGSNLASNGIAACLRRSSGTSGTVPTNYLATSNNNLFWCNPSSGTNNHMTYVEGIGTITNPKNTAADLKVFMVNRDQNSVEENSTFASTIGANSNFLHFANASSTLAESGAVNIATYLDDFDAQTRQGNPGYVGTGSSPDIGADEFDGTNPSFVPVDITPTALVVPSAAGCYTNSETVTASIKNNGTSILDFSANPTTVTVNVTGAVTQTLISTISSGTLAIGASQNVVMPATLDMTTAGTYNFAIITTTTGDGNLTNDNLAGISRVVTASVSTPQQVDFTGYVDPNLNTVFPNWKESNGAILPTGTTSSWLNSSLIAGSGTTAKINLFSSTKNEWIVGPKFVANAASILTYKIAITDFNLSSADPSGMQGTDDKVVVKVSTDCGATYTDLFTHNAANTISITNSLVSQSVSLSAFAGQQIIIAFFGSEGTVDNAPDYDFHIDDIFIGDACSGTPTAGSANAVPASICGSGSSVITTTGMSIGAGIAYSWYSSPTSGGTFTIINGAVSATLNTGTITATTYYKMYTKCTATSDSIATTEVMVTVNPAVVASITPSSVAICPGGNVTLTAAPSGNGETYLWSPGGETNNAITVTPSSTTTYAVLVTATTNCSNTANATVIVNPAPPVTTGVSICAGGSGTISATANCNGFANAGTTLNGTFVAGTDPIALRPTTSIANTSTCSFDALVTRNYQAVNFQVTGTGLYTFDMTSTDDGMAYITSGAFVPGNCLGGGTWIKGDDDSGPGNDPQLSMTLTAGTTYTLISTTYSASSGTSSAAYSWTITPPLGQQIMLPFVGILDWYTTSSGGTSIGSGSPFNPVGVLNSGLPNTNTVGTYTFYAACSGNNTCRTSADFVITELPTVTSVNGGAIYCAGDVVSDVTAAVTGVGPWTVTYTLDGGSPQTANGASSPITLGNAPGVYVVTNIADANCSATASGTQTIIVNPLPTVISVSGGGTYCTGDVVANVTAAVTGIGPWTVTYTIDGGSPQTATGASSPISLGNAEGVYVVTNLADANCTAVASGTQTITVNPLPTVSSVNGGASYCVGSTPSNVTAAVTGTGPWTVTYTLDGGSPQTANGASSPISLGNTPGVYVVTNVSDANCTGPASGIQTIAINPLPTGVISGTTTIATGASAILSFTFTGAPPFSYVYTDGTNNFGPFTSGTLTATQTVSPALTTTYTLLSVTDNNTCSATSLTGSAVVTVTLYPLVQLASQYCGVLNYTTNSALVSTVGVPSAGIIGYDWQYTELESPFNVYTLITPNPGNGMLLSMFPQVQYGRTYSVKTRVRYAGNVTGEFGNSCTIGLAPLPITGAAPSFNNGFFGYCSQINAIPVGGATNYKFVFTSLGNPTVTVNRPNWALPLTLAPGLLLGQTYTLNVFATVAGIEGTTSNPITINMNNFVPNTGINPLINACGAVYATTAAIQAVEVCNASSYTWRFKNTTQVQADIIYTRVGGNRSILLTFPIGLIAGNSYDVDVKASSGGLNGDYSTVCNITIAGGNPGLVHNDDETINESSENKSLSLNTYNNNVSIYPNPSKGDLMMININSIKDENQKVSIDLYDLFGKHLQSSTIANTGSTLNSIFKFEHDLANGIYFINVTLNNKLIATEKISIIK